MYILAMTSMQPYDQHILVAGTYVTLWVPTSLIFVPETKEVSHWHTRYCSITINVYIYSSGLFLKSNSAKKRGTRASLLYIK